VQFFVRRVVHFQPPDSALRPIAIFNAILAGELDETASGTSCRVSNKWLHATLEAEVFALVNFKHALPSHVPRRTTGPTDHWKATIGTKLYTTCT
jgi:hypothetical protein